MPRAFSSLFGVQTCLVSSTLLSISAALHPHPREPSLPLSLAPHRHTALLSRSALMSKSADRMKLRVEDDDFTLRENETQ